MNVLFESEETFPYVLKYVFACDFPFISYQVAVEEK
jgi:hypothetical protein